MSLDLHRALHAASPSAGGFARLAAQLLGSLLAAHCDIGAEMGADHMAGADATYARLSPSAAGRAGTAGGGPAAARGAAVAARRERVAVCFSGWVGVSVEEGGATIARHLLRPLGAETLMALTHLPKDGCGTTEACGLERRFPELAPFAAVDLAPMLSLDELVSKMRALPHWPAVLRAYSSGGPVRCTPRNGTGGGAWRNSSVDGAPYACSGIYLGNSIFAPVLGSSKLHVPCLRPLSYYAKARPFTTAAS